MSELAIPETPTWTCPLCGAHVDDPVLHRSWHDGDFCHHRDLDTRHWCTNPQPCDGHPHRAAYADATWEHPQ